MNEKKLLKRMEKTPAIMFGKPVIKGTRLPIDLLLEKLAYGYTENKLIEEYPYLTNKDIRAVLLDASKIISLEKEYSVA